MPKAQRMDHFTINTDRLEETKRFYAELGLLPGPRPNFAVDGLWLYSEGKPILHVIERSYLPNFVFAATDVVVTIGIDGLVVNTAKYLAGQGLEAQAPAAAPAAAEAPASAPAEAPAAAAEAPKAAASADVIDLAEGAKQCQGSTLKGTQCRHTNGLETIQRAIDGQEYRFLVCGHHSTPSFKPYKGLLDKQAK